VAGKSGAKPVKGRRDTRVRMGVVRKVVNSFGKGRVEQRGGTASR